ncbi:MerR family transcriptional regulator [Phytomonospora sp. NPDC050363]|uniref:MerR family transcriptional regulator n=1 Tax=Phytomonospora sp. NPDC050363 TaxID=3155642 RepID=UPI0033E0296F
MSEAAHMKIGELVERTGVNHRLLRYYEEQGLLSSFRAGGGGHRHYGDDAPGTVRRIRALLSAGLSTSVIRDILPCASGSGLDFDFEACTLRKLRGHLDGIDERLDELQRMRTSLAGLIADTEAGALATV